MSLRDIIYNNDYEEKKPKSKKFKEYKEQEDFKSYGLSILVITPKGSNIAPFKSPGEILQEDDKEKFRNFERFASKNKSWRRILGSKWIGEPVIYKSREYLTEEHALTASYFMDDNDDYARKFSLESRDELSGTSQIENFEKLRAKGGDVRIDSDIRGVDDYQEKIYKSRRLQDVLDARYSNIGGSKTAREVLLATGHALLLRKEGKELKRYTELMKVRERIYREHKGEELKVNKKIKKDDNSNSNSNNSNNSNNKNSGGNNNNSDSSDSDNDSDTDDNNTSDGNKINDNSDNKTNDNNGKE